MRINKLEINNFRCFEHLELELDPQLNVFVGVNGSGKTALLEAIRGALGAFLTGFENEDVEQFYLNEKDVRTEYHGITKIEHRPVRILCQADIGQTQGVTWIREFNKKTTSNTEHIGHIRTIAKQMSLDVRNQVPVELPVLFYFSTQRLWVERKDFGSKANGNPFGGYFNSLNAKSASFFFADWFKRQEQHEFQNAQMGLGKDFSQLELVRRIAVKCMPECKRLYFNAIEEELFVQFEYYDMPVSMLSDGQKTLLLLCTGIALQCVLLNSHLGLEAANQAKGIVLIDEVDLHLHPSWQRIVIQIFTEVFPNLQFFITTHSPQVLSEVPGKCVFKLENFQISRQEIYTEGRDSNAILEDVFGYPELDDSAVEQIQAIYDKIDLGNADAAKNLLAGLIRKRGENDREVVRIQSFIDFL